MNDDRDLPAPRGGPLPPRKGTVVPPPYHPPPPAPPPRPNHQLDLGPIERPYVVDADHARASGSVPLVLAGNGARNGRSSRLTFVAVLVCVGLLAVIVALVATRDPSTTVADDGPATSLAPVATATTAVATSDPGTSQPPSVVETTEPPAAVPDQSPAAGVEVATLPGGLFCRDLRQMGVSFAGAVDYWQREGRTDRMDIDLNGVPCETVYDPSEVRSVFPSATVAARPPSTSLPAGLFCRDLMDRGVDVHSALDYYISEGFPERMDADGDRVPCETVYTDAESVWFRDY